MNNVESLTIKQIEKFSQELAILAEKFYYRTLILEAENKRLKEMLRRKNGH